MKPGLFLDKYVLLDNDGQRTFIDSSILDQLGVNYLSKPYTERGQRNVWQ